MVDTRTPKFLDRYGRSALKGANRVIIYDHHVCSIDEYRPYIKGSIEVTIHDTDAKMSSCCEVIWHLLKEEERKRLSKETLIGVLHAIYDESSGFVYIGRSTNALIAELINLGVHMGEVTRCRTTEFGMWGKLKYFGKSIQQLLWLKEAKIAIIKTNFTDYSAANHTIMKEAGKNRAPVYILGALHKNKIKYCRTLEAYALVYDRELDDNQLKFSIVLDLVK